MQESLSRGPRCIAIGHSSVGKRVGHHIELAVYMADIPTYSVCIPAKNKCRRSKAAAVGRFCRHTCRAQRIASVWQPISDQLRRRPGTPAGYARLPFPCRLRAPGTRLDCSWCRQAIAPEQRKQGHRLQSTWLPPTLLCRGRLCAFSMLHRTDKL